MMNYWKPYENIRLKNKKLIIPGRVWQCRAQIIIRFEEPKKKCLILGLSPVQTGVDATNS
jgi:hypothetical protein